VGVEVTLDNEICLYKHKNKAAKTI
jgi:hypothetical protein